jgi:hypothetical protein
MNYRTRGSWAVMAVTLGSLLMGALPSQAGSMSMSRPSVSVSRVSAPAPAPRPSPPPMSISRPVVSTPAPAAPAFRPSPPMAVAAPTPRPSIPVSAPVATVTVRPAGPSAVAVTRPTATVIPVPVGSMAGAKAVTTTPVNRPGAFAQSKPAAVVNGPMAATGSFKPSAPAVTVTGPVARPGGFRPSVTAPPAAFRTQIRTVTQRPITVTRVPVRTAPIVIGGYSAPAVYYGGYSDYSYGWSHPNWLTYTPFSPTFYFNRPVYYEGQVYPGSFNFGTLILTIAIASVLIWACCRILGPNRYRNTGLSP